MERLIVEYHYAHGDAGAYYDDGQAAALALWSLFPGREDDNAERFHPTYILVRPNSPDGETVSTRLLANRFLYDAVAAFIDAYDASRTDIHNTPLERTYQLAIHAKAKADGQPAYPEFTRKTP